MSTLVSSDQIQAHLLSDENLAYQDIIDDIKGYITAEPTIRSDEGGHLAMPRFGSLSLFVRSMPMYVYDHPDIMGAFGDTAFTDGQNSFFCVNFLKKIMENEQHALNGLTFLALHEACHPFFLHHERLRKYPPDFANGAQDMAINTRLLRDFADPKTAGSMCSLSPLPAALAIGIGFKDGDVEKYAHRSEEDIAREMWEELEKQQKAIEEFLNDLVGQLSSASGKKPPPGPGMKIPGKGSPGNGAGEAGDGDDSEAGDGDGAKTGKKGKKSTNVSDNGMGHEHLVTPERLAEALKKAGLGGLIEKLDIPVGENGKLDVEKEATISNNNQIRAQNAVNAMEMLRSKLGDRMPGAHCHDHAREQLQKLNQPKITWKTTIKTALLGNGMKTTDTFDHPGDAYFIDPAQMGLSSRLYIGAKIPSRPNGFFVNILDTSGSMSHENLREAASEIMGIVSNNKNKAPDVILFHVDTVSRGLPTIITPQNIDALLKDGFSARGRGGTNLLAGIHQAMASQEVAKRIKSGQKCLGLMYFTDLGDSAPKKEQLPKNMPKNVFYFAVNGTYNDRFANEVSNYAITVSMGDKMTVELDAKNASVQGNGNNRQLRHQ